MIIAASENNQTASEKSSNKLQGN